MSKIYIYIYFVLVYNSRKNILVSNKVAQNTAKQDDASHTHDRTAKQDDASHTHDHAAYPL